MRLLLVPALLMLLARTALAADFPWPPEFLFKEFSDEREMRDLQAQEDMAKWAYWMLVATIGSAFVGFGGMVAVLVNIRQTRVALDEAKKSNVLTEKHNRIETRPFLVVKKFEISELNIDKSDDDLHIYLKGTVHIQNVGKTPTLPATISCVLNYSDKSAEGREEGSVSTAVSIAPGETVPLSVVEGQNFKRDNCDQNEDRLSVVFRIDYTDRHRDEKYFTSWHAFLYFAEFGHVPQIMELIGGSYSASAHEGNHVFLK